MCIGSMCSINYMGHPICFISVDEFDEEMDGSYMNMHIHALMRNHQIDDGHLPDKATQIIQDVFAKLPCPDMHDEPLSTKVFYENLPLDILCVLRLFYRLMKVVCGSFKSPLASVLLTA